MNPVNSGSSSPLNFDSESEDDIDIEETVQAEKEKTAAFVKETMKGLNPLQEEAEKLNKAAKEMKGDNIFANVEKSIADIETDIKTLDDMQKAQQATLTENITYYGGKVEQIRVFSNELIPSLTEKIQKVQNHPVADMIYSMAERGATNGAQKGSGSEKPWHIEAQVEDIKDKMKQFEKQLENEVKKHDKTHT